MTTRGRGLRQPLWGAQNTRAGVINCSIGGGVQPPDRPRQLAHCVSIEFIENNGAVHTTRTCEDVGGVLISLP